MAGILRLINSLLWTEPTKKMLDLDDTEEDLICILEGYRDQVTEVKAELTVLESPLLNSDVPTDDPVMRNQA